MTRPRVSVIVPVHGRLRLLDRAAASVLAQTETRLELILVDDASPKPVAAWAAARVQDARLRCLRLERQGGHVRARNAGIARARAPLVAFLDSDDLWRPRYLETLLPLFDDASAQIVFCDYDLIDAEGRVLRRGAIRPPSGELGRALAPALGKLPMPLPPATIVRRALFERVGPFDEAFRRGWDDWDFFCRVGRALGPKAFRFVDRALVEYRRHAAQQTRHDARRPFVRVRLEQGRDLRRAGQADRERLLDFAYFSAKHASWL